MREYSDLALSTSYCSRVRITEADSAHRIYPHELLSFMQEAADLQGKPNQTSSLDFEKRGLAYMISRIRVDLQEIAEIKDEELFVVTWIQGVKGVRILRDFDFFLSRPLKENYLGSAEIELFVVDLESRKPQRLANVFGDDYKNVFSSPIKVFNETTDKIQTIFSSWEDAKNSCLFKACQKVSYTEVDANLHMNNTHYLAGATDAVVNMELESGGVFPQIHWSKIQLNYESEVLFGESLHYFVQAMDQEEIKSDEKAVLIEAWIQERACPAFRAKIVYSRIE